jgi:CHAT domain-containing protein
LPAALAEGRRLAAQPGLPANCLLAEEATWPHLLALAEPGGLAGYTFLHVASHAFRDPVSGRLGGLALSDRNLLLDEVWELAPLPSLVTLSACSGSRSRLYAGDEQVGLAATCLAAGAQTFVGSLWPVLDETAVALMADFYASLAAGSGPARALALAQRRAWQHTNNLEQWGGFLCTGLP